MSGGDARIQINAPARLHASITLWLNGQPLAAALQSSGDNLEGVISGLALGSNLLEARTTAGVRASLTLVNHPVTGPMFSGPQQQPFVCMTNQSAVGKQPLVDSAAPPGYPVTDGSGNTIGYSRDCSITTFVNYLYRNTAGSFVALPAGPRPADMATTTLPDGRTVDFRGAPRDRQHQPLPLQHRDAGAGRRKQRPCPTPACGTRSCCTGSRAAWPSATARARCTAAR